MVIVAAFLLSLLALVPPAMAESSGQTGSDSSHDSDADSRDRPRGTWTLGALEVARFAGSSGDPSGTDLHSQASLELSLAGQWLGARIEVGAGFEALPQPVVEAHLGRSVAARPAGRLAVFVPLRFGGRWQIDPGAALLAVWYPYATFACQDTGPASPSPYPIPGVCYDDALGLAGTAGARLTYHPPRRSTWAAALEVQGGAMRLAPIDPRWTTDENQIQLARGPVWQPTLTTSARVGWTF